MSYKQTICITICRYRIWVIKSIYHLTPDGCFVISSAELSSGDGDRDGNDKDMNHNIQTEPFFALPGNWLFTEIDNQEKVEIKARSE